MSRLALWMAVLAASIFLHPVASAQQAAAVAYAPSFSPCPSGTSLIRSAGVTEQTLSSSENEYIKQRQLKSNPAAWLSYLHTVEANAGHNGVPLPSYISEILTSSDVSHRPNLGIAVSGGGHRAALFGAGVLQSLDGRNASSVSIGTGGLLQTANYLSGLSGGSWMVTSLSQANFPTIPNLIFGDATHPNDYAGWITQIDLTSPSSNLNVTDAFILDLIAEVAGKFQQGFPVTSQDVWARILARHFVNGTTVANFFDTSALHGAGELFSSLASLNTFVNHQQPLPIIVTDSISKHGNASAIDDGFVPLTNPIYEWTPFEMGSYDPVLAAFTPTKFVGSPNNSLCVTGFDQASYVTGISSNLFAIFNTSLADLENSIIGPIIELINATFSQPNIELDAAAVPNPFRGFANGTFIDTTEDFLTLVDGGSDGEGTPYQPLLVKARKVDTIIAVDGAGDINNFASGSSIITSQERASLFPSTYSFPLIPNTTSTFLSQNLTKHPTFFGCNTKNTDDSPLIIYIANGGPPLGQTPVTNTSTFQTSYTHDQAQAFLDQTFDIATQGIASGNVKDSEWGICLACAVVERARRSSGIERSGICESCLERYCWS